MWFLYGGLPIHQDTIRVGHGPVASNWQHTGKGTADPLQHLASNFPCTLLRPEYRQARLRTHQGACETAGARGKLSTKEIAVATATIIPSTPSPGLQAGQHLLTVADLAALSSDLPSGTVLYELDSERLIIMPPPGADHGFVENKFAGAFLYQGEKRGFGKACCGEVGIVLWRNPDRVIGVDAAFITNASLPIRKSPEGYPETVPELILEIKSKNDSLPDVERKVADCFRGGAKVLLVAEPAKKNRGNLPPPPTMPGIDGKCCAYACGHPPRIQNTRRGGLCLRAEPKKGTGTSKTRSQSPFSARQPDPR
jgi:Uma2 family endonuclease